MNRLVLLLLISAGSGFPQAVSPELLLQARVMRHMAEVVSRWPDYTCIETIQRVGRAQDTLRFEVAYAGGKEVYSWPGAQKFSGESLGSMAGVGLISTGAFTTFARNLFVNRAAQVHFAGWSVERERQLAAFGFEISALSGAWQLRSTGGPALVGARGQFVVDARTLDLIRLEIQATEIPLMLNAKAVSLSVAYETFRLNGDPVILPEWAAAVWTEPNGTELRDRIAFSHYRSFRGEARLRTDTEAPAMEEKAETAKPQISIPAGLAISMTLAEPIDSQSAVVGQPVTAVIVKAVHKGGFVIPAGARVYGRLRRFQEDRAPVPHFTVSLEFSEIEIDGVKSRLFARLERVDAPDVSGTIVTSRSRSRTIRLAPDVYVDGQQAVSGLAVEARTDVDMFTPAEIPGVATVIVTAAHLHLGNDFRMEWRSIP